MPSRLAVIGGGPAGLFTAHTAQKAGLEVTLLESASRFGGKIFSMRGEGFVVESGPEGVAATPEVLRLIGELDLETLSPNPSPSPNFLLHKGKTLPLPDVPASDLPTAIIPLLSRSARFRLAFDWLSGKTSDPDESLEHFIRRRMGDEAWALLARPMSHAVYGADPADLSVKSAFHALWEREQKGNAEKAAGEPPQWVSFKGGMGTWMDALLAVLQGKIRAGVNVEVLAIGRNGEVWEVFTQQGKVEVETVVFATSPQRMARILRPIYPQATTLLNQVPSLLTASVSLAFRSADFPATEGHRLILNPAYKAESFTWSSERWAGRAPEGFRLVRVNFAGDIARLGDTELANIALGELKRFLGKLPKPLATWPFRLGSVPVYKVGHTRRLEAIESAVNRMPGVFTAGLGLKGLDLADAVRESQQAVGRALNYLALQPQESPSTS